ncbi:ARCA-like protein [Grosmannia clavigera kw1407]|uniref:ARCA-like protein n=1 Tax=Grosmannia clavigera (strain kw1407 / UAMH 11150) TaxID=655863 RepID=F0XHT6_GROCL|nr:ARCA-like protein [Grosmannia clavigera kw1407]EFX03235.1 ARCA-like protein [Grosmannia clavigera kw1407]
MTSPELNSRPEPDNTASFGWRPKNARVQSLFGPFTRTQQWVKTPATLQFVDGATADDDFPDDDGFPDASSWQPIRSDRPPNGPHAQASALQSAQNNVSQVPVWSTLSPDSTGSTRTDQSTQAAAYDAPDNPLRLGFAPALNQVAQLRSQSPSDRFIVHDEMGPGSTFDLHEAINAVQSVQSRIYLEKSAFPLQDKQEALLLRHFVQNQAGWATTQLDICDPARHFATTVPLRAGTCTVLLNATLALAAKHLAHISDFDRYASDRYHRECLSVLIPLMSHEVTAADENLFAATIILRIWEEMEVKHTGVDSHSYILGIHAFVHGNGHNLRPKTLGAASFWAGLRQEIYTATMNQQPVKAPLVSSLVDGSRELGPADDEDWANRAVVHCVDVLNFCFGEEPPRQTWDGLYAWNERWTASLPPSYTPTLDKENRPGEAFPEIWYHDTWQVTGVQHHILATLFLVSFDPSFPRIGGRRREAAKRMDTQMMRAWDWEGVE